MWQQMTSIGNCLQLLYQRNTTLRSTDQLSVLPSRSLMKILNGYFATPRKRHPMLPWTKANLLMGSLLPKDVSLNSVVFLHLTIYLQLLCNNITLLILAIVDPHELNSFTDPLTFWHFITKTFNQSDRAMGGALPTDLSFEHWYTGHIFI